MQLWELWMEMGAEEYLTGSAPNREWTDDIEDRFQHDHLHSWRIAVLNWGLWKQVVMRALDTYRPSAQGS